MTFEEIDFRSMTAAFHEHYIFVRNARALRKAGAFSRLPFGENLDARQRVKKARRLILGMTEKPLIDSAPEKIVSLAAETQFAENGIVSRSILNTRGLRITLFGFSAGQELTEHTSPGRAVIQILSGECEFRLTGKANRLQSGDLLYLPPNLPHAVRATTQFSMLLTLSNPEAKP
jgi:quercetin dioxygenase-like cupin family protein